MLVHKAVAAQFTELLAAKIKEFYGEDPSQSPDYCRIASERHTARFARLLEGQTIHTGGQVDVAKRYVAPTIVLDPAPDSELMQEEIFGPVLPIRSYASLDGAIAEVEGRDRPLALYPFSHDRANVERILGRLVAGGVTVNDTLLHFAANALPFGGIGPSGMGQYHGRAGFDALTKAMPVLWQARWSATDLLKPPYTGKVDQLIRWLAG